MDEGTRAKAEDSMVERMIAALYDLRDERLRQLSAL